MPRMDSPKGSTQLVKLLLIGDGKCGKTDFAGMAGASNFQILYLDGDVASQTIADLPLEARRNVYLLKCGDDFNDSGGIDPTYALFFKKWITQPTIVWNDSKQRIHDIQRDGTSNEEDEYWLIRPARMDENCILVIEWTALAHSAMQWAANEAGVDLGEIDERKEMRGVYQAAGEKLTQYLLAIQRAPCHVICLSHPREFIKLTPPAGKTIGNIKEKDMQIAWTKMVPSSSSNNHALSMAKYFTDVAWMQAGLMGKREIDFRIDNNRIGGGHFSDKFTVPNRDKDEKSGFTFANLVKKIGGTIPSEIPSIDHWLTIQQGYEVKVPQKKQVVLGGKPTQSPAGTSAPVLQQPKKGVISLGGIKQRVPNK